MNDAIRAMLKNYGKIQSARDEENALKEIIQLITLHGLHRGKFFDTAAFYGGTALRLLHGIDRFSEDLDFCLKVPDLHFKISKYFDAVLDELARFDFSATLTEKNTGPDAIIESAFVKQDTYQGLLVIGKDNKTTQKGKLIKIRIEVDKINPEGAAFEQKLVKLPTPYLLTSFSADTLFAGKVHALIARAYANRVKGRDYYDFLYFLTRDTPINLKYLEAKLRNSGHFKGNTRLSREKLLELLTEKFRTVDFAKACEDVKPFLKPAEVAGLDTWNAELFIAISQNLVEA